tara:strand:- start:24006 stop:24482 length:477 start_codon:yes stop_codon:yes gene_type:complete
VLPNNGYLIIPEQLLDKLHQFKQSESHHKEAGGLLIGCKRINGAKDEVTHFELTDCSTPHFVDKRSRYGFLRRSGSHIKKVLTAWTNSNQLQTYLGEWHTHPEPHPTPSASDINEWKKNLKGQKAILIIIGQKSDWFAYWNGSQAIVIQQPVKEINSP